jgi:hypothetical protein
LLKEKNKMENEKKGLILIPDWTLCRELTQYYSDVVDVPVDEEDELNIPIAEEMLRNNPYELVLIEGHLNRDIEGEYFDGRIIAERIREGVYGPVNQDISLYTHCDFAYAAFPEYLGVKSTKVTESDIDSHRLSIHDLVKELGIEEGK